MNDFRDFFKNSPLFVIEESGNPFVNDKIRRATAEEIVENFAKEMKALEEAGVKFSMVTIDSYDNIREE